MNEHSSLKIGAAGFSKTLVPLYQAVLCHKTIILFTLSTLFAFPCISVSNMIYSTLGGICMLISFTINKFGSTINGRQYL